MSSDPFTTRAARGESEALDQAARIEVYLGGEDRPRVERRGDHAVITDHWGRRVILSPRVVRLAMMALGIVERP